MGKKQILKLKAGKPVEGSPFIAEVSDMLFATKSLDKIAKGQATWGDLANVGVTAASFVVSPVALGLLGAGALLKVIKVASKVAAMDVAPVAVKRTAAKTLDDALIIKRQGYMPTGDEPIKRVGRAGLGEPTPPYQLGQSILKREGGEFDLPTKAAIAEKGMPGKKYTRPVDEDIDPFNLDRDLLQEADDAIAMSGPLKPKNQRLTKEEYQKQSAERTAESSQYYDKRNFTPEEIKERIDRLSYDEKKMLNGKSPEEIEDYVRSGDYEYIEVYKTTTRPSTQEFLRGAKEEEVTETILRKIRSGEYTDAELEVAFKALPKVNASIIKDENKVISNYSNMLTILKMEKANPGLLGKGQKEILEFESRKLKKEYTKIKKSRLKEESIVKQVDEEMPGEIQKVKPESKLIIKDNVEEASDGFYDDVEKGLIERVSEDATDLPSKLKPGTKTKNSKRFPNPEVVKIKVPEKARMDKDLREGLSLPAQKLAELQSEIEKLNTFNKLNSSKIRYASKDEVLELKKKSADNKDLIEKYQKQLLILKRAIPQEEVGRAAKVSEEITKRALERRKYPFGSSGISNERFMRSKTYVSGVPLSTADKIAKEKAKIEKLRKKWQTIPAWETEAKSKLKEEAKKSADYIKRLEADTEAYVSRETALKPISSFRGENSFLSNMSSSPVKLGEVTYPTVEHAFQAAKTTDPTERAKILAAKTAAEAKKIGKTVTLRKNWNQMREEVMEKALRAKFEQNPELKKKLIDTGDVDLIESNTWGDTFWGQVNGKGENKLGKLLMKIRKELMEGK